MGSCFYLPEDAALPCIEEEDEVRLAARLEELACDLGCKRLSSEPLSCLPASRIVLGLDALPSGLIDSALSLISFLEEE